MGRGWLYLVVSKEMLSLVVVSVCQNWVVDFVGIVLVSFIACLYFVYVDIYVRRYMRRVLVYFLFDSFIFIFGNRGGFFKEIKIFIL